jgi:hypothetical protein|tara:strand:+ start:47 stop:1003 length:957 start_codon:yes stop_codon:yes gene_type:complete
MNTLVETKVKEKAKTFEVTLPQDLTTEDKFVSVKQVYNLSFSKHGSKVLTNFYKKTTKEENSKEFFDLVELIKKGFQEEEKLLKELKKNHPPERKVVSKKIRGLLPLKKTDKTGLQFDNSTFETRFERASKLGHLQFLGYGKIRIEDRKGKNQLTCQWNEIQKEIPVKYGSNTEMVPTPDKRINLSFEDMNKFYKERVLGIVKEGDNLGGSKGGSTMNSPLEKFVHFLTEHTEDNEKMSQLVKKITSTQWDTKTYNIGGMVEGTEIQDLVSKFIKLVQKEIKAQEEELIEEELAEKEKLYSKPTKGPKGLSQALAING